MATVIRMRRGGRTHSPYYRIVVMDSRSRTRGVGIRFPADEKSRLLKIKIEEILGASLGSERPTQTL